MNLTRENEIKACRGRLEAEPQSIGDKKLRYSYERILENQYPRGGRARVYL